MPKKRYDDFSVKYTLAAPCGMYCGHCKQYLAGKKGMNEGCEGCRIRNKNCTFIRKDCELLRKNIIHFCYECDKLPCDKLKKLDGMYRKKYDTSLIENLERIKSIGPDAWLEEQREASKCPECGGCVCVHDRKCYDCGAMIKR